MTRTRTKALAVMLGASIAISGVCTAFPAMEMEVSALDTTTQVTYPVCDGGGCLPIRAHVHNGDGKGVGRQMGICGGQV